jgi:hypothetical protein
MLRDFNFTVRKSLTRPILVNDKDQAINEMVNPNLFKF